MKEINNINVNDIVKTLKLLPMHVQALHNDSVLYFSDEETIATSERQDMLVNDIRMIEDLLSVVKRNLVIPNNNA